MIGSIAPRVHGNDEASRSVQKGSRPDQRFGWSGRFLPTLAKDPGGSVQIRLAASMHAPHIWLPLN